MMRLLAASLLTAAFVLAGCAAPDEGAPATGADGASDLANLGPGTLYEAAETAEGAVAGLFAAAEPLYRDPQNTPHPAFNFPTLAWPAAGEDVPDLWKPIPPAPLPDQITGLELVKKVDGVPSGAGIAIFGSLVVVPGFGANSSVVDISDPTAPKVLALFDPQEGLGTHRGAAFVPYPDGRLVAVISTGPGIDVWDLTDPTKPAPLPPLTDAKGELVRSHKVGVIPGTPIVVNAASGGGDSMNPETSPGITKMWDLSDPTRAVVLPDFKNGYSCHHVYFWNDRDEGKYRGVCAGVDYTQLWDTSDPYDPTVIVSIPFGTGGTPGTDAGSVQFSAGLSHYAGLSADGKVLLMGDESGGGSTPPGCIGRVDVPGLGSVSVPVGAVWFYDVSDEQNPRLLNWYSASQLDKTSSSDATRSCTAHHGRLVPVNGRDVLAMSWYGSGVIVVDFTAVRGEGAGLPETVAQFADDSDTWETWYYQGYLFTGDLARGMDILRMT